jgi:hypothetical protein
LVAEEDEDAVCGFKSTVGGTRRLYSKQRERGNGGLTRDQLEEWEGGCSGGWSGVGMRGWQLLVAGECGWAVPPWGSRGEGSGMGEKGEG